MQEVSAVCNEIIIINEGRMIVKDTPDHISSHMEQANELSMEVKGNKELIHNTIEALEQIRHFKVENTDQEEHYRVTIIADTGQDIREDVFYALAGNRCAILEMQMKEPSLEEIFIRLTGNGSRQMAERVSGIFSCADRIVFLYIQFSGWIFGFFECIWWH